MRHAPRTSSEDLVRKILKHELRESEELEWKSLEVLETNEGRRDVVRHCSAIANTGGGTFVIGVGQGRRSDLIQSLSPTHEYENDLNSIIRDNTDPMMGKLIEMKRDTLEVGATLLRIDISPSRGSLTRFFMGAGPKFVAFHRVGSTTQEMTAADVEQWTKADAALNKSGAKSNHQHASAWETAPQVESSFLATGLKTKQPDPTSCRVRPYRLEWAGTGRDVVFGQMPFLSGSQPSLYSLQTFAGVRSRESLDLLFNSAQKNLGAQLDHRFAYSIEQNGYICNGWTAREMLADFRDLRNVVETLVAMKGRRHPDNWYYAPTVTAYTPCLGGIFWMSLQSRETTEFREAECGLLLPGVLFDDSGAKKFFDDIGSTPLHYEKTIGVQCLRIGWLEPLQNPTPVRVDPAEKLAWRVAVDNPFYGTAETLASRREWQIPKDLAEDIARIPRIPVEVRGGYVPGDKAFGGDTTFEIVSNYFGPGLFISALTSPLNHP